MKCDYCLNSRPIFSENGFHSICCLSSRAAYRCLTGEKDKYVAHPDAPVKQTLATMYGVCLGEIDLEK